MTRMVGDLVRVHDLPQAAPLSFWERMHGAWQSLQTLPAQRPGCHASDWVRGKTP
jgi:hypothetical protein